MCTALSLKTKDHYFGRTLDIDRSYGEEVAIMPRRFPLAFRTMGECKEHFAMMGMATFAGDYPLFYEATNERGLSMAGLNFPGNAYYSPMKEGTDNIAPFEFIPWILSKCQSVSEARVLLSRLNLADIPFSDALPPAPLHWMISDREESITVEAMRSGLRVHDNPIGIMTNNPPFEHQMKNLEKYKHLRKDNRDVILEETEEYTAYCQGLGAVGLPGDVSSMSRFARLAFLKENSVSDEDELSSVGRFFHLLSAVEMIKGTCVTDGGHLDITVYTSCANTDKGIYYYTTYGNRRITAIDMHKEDLDGEKAFRFSLRTEESIDCMN